jgi:exosortase/archaeosortase family protein
MQKKKKFENDFGKTKNGFEGFDKNFGGLKNKSNKLKKDSNGLEKYFKGLKNYFRSQEKKILENPKKQFSFFILFFLATYLILSFAIIPFENNIKAFVGETSIVLLEMQGHEITGQGFYQAEEISYSFFVDNVLINIIGLCTGVLEIIILIGAILATLGISLKKKLIGVGVGIVVGIIFNLLRIFITINIILFNSIEFAELMHGVLFRIILFVYITGFYIVWFYISMNGLPKKLKNILKIKNVRK